MIPDSCPCRKAFFFQLRSSEKNTSFARHDTIPLFQSHLPTFLIANCTFHLQSTLCFPFLRCVSFIFIHKPAIHVVSVISAEVNAHTSSQIAASVRLRPKHHTEHLELPPRQVWSSHTLSTSLQRLRNHRNVERRSFLFRHLLYLRARPEAFRLSHVYMILEI